MPETRNALGCMHAKLSKLLLMAVCFLFFATFFATLLTYNIGTIQLGTYLRTYIMRKDGTVT